jgi:hypothetical protein
MMQATDSDSDLRSIGEIYWSDDDCEQQELHVSSWASRPGYAKVGFQSGEKQDEQVDDERHQMLASSPSALLPRHKCYALRSRGSDDDCSFELDAKLDGNDPQVKVTGMCSCPERRRKPTQQQQKNAFGACYGYIFVTMCVMAVLLTLDIQKLQSTGNKKSPRPQENDGHVHNQAAFSQEEDTLSTTTEEELEKMKEAMVLEELNNQHLEQSGTTIEHMPSSRFDEELDEELEFFGDEENKGEVVDGMQLTGQVETLCGANDAGKIIVDKCLDICQPSACCFNTDIMCAPELMGCNPYAYCDVLLELTDFATGAAAATEDGGKELSFDASDTPFVDGMMLTGQIQHLCDETDVSRNEESLAKCMDICKPSKCCFDSNIVCAPDLIGCEPYVYCDVLLGEEGFLL